MPVGVNTLLFLAPRWPLPAFMVVPLVLEAVVALLLLTFVAYKWRSRRQAISTPVDVRRASWQAADGTPTLAMPTWPTSGKTPPTMSASRHLTELSGQPRKFRRFGPISSRYRPNRRVI